MLFVYQKALIQTFHTSFLDYKITYVNSQLENSNSNGNLYSKTGFKCTF